METTSDGDVAVGARRRPFHRLVDGMPRCAWLDPDIYRESLKFRPRRGDLIQSTYPKSGTYWVQYITQLILKGGNPVTTYNEFTSHTHALEYMRHSDWKPTLPMRLFFTHLPFRTEIMNKEVKYVYVARNPWDVCVSFYNMMTDVSIWNFQDGTFEEFVDAFLETDLGYGSYFDHVATGYSLKDESNVFFVTYEDIKRDTHGAVLRLSRFWESVTFRLCKKTTISSKRSRGYRGDKTKYPMVRTARVGGWKDYFTPDLLARMEQKIREQGDKAAFMELWKDIREEAAAMAGMNSTL
ncbi:hypothetical protein HPB50_003061 [Hyalomma asiaticum]|uniref:Uncharacterized protein n=1 Tax=Hyalomma asiaticum TaxID=266040 RepID=A0ACB7SBB6_HYAAI|nr:hypothetical protein HPB50_003061 [Hyalomma asiaticum]